MFLLKFQYGFYFRCQQVQTASFHCGGRWREQSAAEQRPFHSGVFLVSSSILFSIGCSSEVIVHGDSIADTANVSEVQAYQLNVKKMFWTDPYVEGVGTGISQVKFIVNGEEKVSVNVSNGKFKVRTSFLGLDSKTKVFEVEGISNTGQIVTKKKCEVLPKLHDAYEMNTSNTFV